MPYGPLHQPMMLTQNRGWGKLHDSQHNAYGNALWHVFQAEAYHVTHHHAKVDNAQYICNALPATIYSFEDVGPHPDDKCIFAALQRKLHVMLLTLGMLISMHACMKISSES